MVRGWSEATILVGPTSRVAGSECDRSGPTPRPSSCRDSRARKQGGIDGHRVVNCRMGIRDRVLGRVRDEVERRRLSVEDVAQRCGLSARTVRRLLAGETASWETLAKVEAGLRVQL